MIRSLIAAELRDHPGKAIAAFVATVLVVPVVWVLYVVTVVALEGIGVPR